jgi:glycosyltransferase involved in cell wall biosynthesis
MSEEKVKITHLSSVHPRYDTRIFLKELRTLAEVSAYQVSLVIADGKGDQMIDNISIYDLGKPNGRLERMRKTTKMVFNKALELNSDVYHLHDPELIPTGIKLKKAGKKVIFDAHEDVPKQLLGKPYLNRPLLKLVAGSFSAYEKHTSPRFDAIVTATPSIREKFEKMNSYVVNVNNFPIIGELDKPALWKNRLDKITYVGGISEIRGIRELIKAIDLVDNIHLNLIGQFSEQEIYKEVKEYGGWRNVEELGFLGREEVAEVLSQSKAGVVTFHPLPNHIDAQPNKMFEYMSAGVPLITSDFPLWREIVMGNECGICVDPLDPKAIAGAMKYIIDHPEEAERMGKNGQKAVLEKYNWSIEKEKLLKMYQRILEKN